MNRIYLGGALLITLIAAINVRGGGGHCHRCGCQCEVQKVCRAVCEMKDTTKTTYDYKCEDFCVPGKSQRCPKCDECDCGCNPGKKTYDWIPGCANVRTKKVLVKYEEKVKKPTYKWVVEDLCPHCAEKCKDGAEG